MILTYKYRLKDKSAAKLLRRHAVACNQVWNYCNAYQRDIERRYRAGAPKRIWPNLFALTYLTAGSSKILGTHADSIASVCQKFVANRNANGRSLSFRPSHGPRRALGWVPFREKSRRIDGNSVVFLGRRYRWFGSKRRPLPENAKGGAFVEDARGRWWVTFHAEVSEHEPAKKCSVGIDLGLKTLVTISNGGKVEALQHYRQWETRLAVAQRAGNKRRVRAIHSRIANARRDHLHKASTQIVRANGFIAVGDVSSSKLAKTRMAKSVLDAGWASFKHMLRYKCQKAGAVFVEVNESFTSQTCSACGVIPASSPKGVGALGMRSWVCECGAVHDRDVNAARNILRIGLSVQAHADESRTEQIADRHGMPARKHAMKGNNHA